MPTYMKNNLLLLLLIYSFSGSIFCQNYTSYFTGNQNDSLTQGGGGVCLMGGATEHDNAMKWFLQRANGGDVLVLRASGSDGYNTYLYSDLGVSVNSVETIVFNNASAANESYIQDKIKNAEAIWFAGGDQWDYITYWRNTVIDSLINIGILERNIVIGGTSAGMAIQGQYYFTAQNGTVTSSTALANPYQTNVTISNDEFLLNNKLLYTITDTHFDNPDRKGRLVTFLARILTDTGVQARAIACDEYTAVCIDENGIAKSYGDYPNYDEDIYFVQVNCDLGLNEVYPEVCQDNTPLTWDLNNEALIVYNIKGTNSANNSFDLNDWKTASGGTWKYWSVNNGLIAEQNINGSSCVTLNTESLQDTFFNYHIENNILKISNLDLSLKDIKLIDLNGKMIYYTYLQNENTMQIDLTSIQKGFYFLEVTNQKKKQVVKVLNF